MKKNILVLFIAAAFTTGCSISDIVPWKSEDNKSISEESNKKVEDESQNGSNENGQESNEDVKPTGIATKTINFYGNSLPNEWTAPGVSMDSTLLSCKTQNERMVNMTNSQVNNNNLLSEVFFTKLNTAYYDSSSLVVQIGTGNPAKGDFKSGTFTWTSVNRIIRVDITAMCYAKTQGAIDSTAHLLIEAGDKGTDKDYDRPINNSTTKDMSFAVGSDETPNYKTYSIDFAEGIDRFCLSSLDGRIFLKSLSITWWA